MNDLVKVIDGQVRASSRTVAEMFDKQHKDVLRAIDGLLEQRPELERNFAPLFDSYEAGNGAQRQARVFEMDRKGFSLLAMGFTGAKALEWKVRFIDAFDAMERALTEGLSPGGGIMGTPEAVENLKLSLQIAREIRVTFGTVAARKAWHKLGLPLPGSADPSSRSDLVLPPPGDVLEWRAERLMPGPGGARIKVSELYQDYCDWCAARNIIPRPLTSFGIALNKMGIDKLKSGPVWVTGYKLAA